MIVHKACYTEVERKSKENAKLIAELDYWKTKYQALQELIRKHETD